MKVYVSLAPGISRGMRQGGQAQMGPLAEGTGAQAVQV